MNTPRSSTAMFRSRTRLRASAALTAVLLVVTGAGEILGACHCVHRGGEHGGGHALTEAPDAQGTGGASGGHGGHAPDDDDAHRGHLAGQLPDGGDAPPDAGHDPAGDPCRVLCALACATAQPPAPDGIQRVPDAASGAWIACAPPTERTDHVADASRPHVLPPSQGPPLRG